MRMRNANLDTPFFFQVRGDGAGAGVGRRARRGWTGNYDLLHQAGRKRPTESIRNSRGRGFIAVSSGQKM